MILNVKIDTSCKKIAKLKLNIGIRITYLSPKKNVCFPNFSDKASQHVLTSSKTCHVFRVNFLSFSPKFNPFRFTLLFVT